MQSLAQAPRTRVNYEVGHRGAKNRANDEVNYSHEASVRAEELDRLQVDRAVEKKADEHGDEQEFYRARDLESLRRILRIEVKRHDRHEQYVLHSMRDRVAVKRDVHVGRNKHREKEANEREVKNSEQWCCSFEVPHINDDARDQNCCEDPKSDLVKQFERAVQIIWRNSHSENLERPNDSTVRAELDHESFIPVWRRSSRGDRDKRIDACVLTSIMKRLPRPEDQEYVGLNYRSREREEQPGADREEYRKVDISRPVSLKNFRKVFIDVEEDCSRNVCGTEKQQGRFHAGEAVQRAFDS